MNPAMVAVFGTNSEMSFDGSNQVPLWTYNWKKFQNILKEK